MLLGMQMRDSGIKRYPIRVRPRIIQYAITLVLRENSPNFLRTLRQKLVQLYPLNQQYETTRRTSIMYIYYPGEFNWLEFLPLCSAFVLLFLYVYFSIRKIDVIRSRFILAFSAVITVLSSLMMSLGVCFFFGLTISLQSKGVFQYLVILVGLENVLVITKSVVSTDDTFDVKIRVAQALSKEGWTISKTLLTEITILTIGLATFVPVIQEFCIFAIVGLISDFFLQMMLFSTVVALDIKRIEFSNLPKNSQNDGIRRIPLRNSTITSSLTINRSRSHPKLTTLDTSSSCYNNHDIITSNNHHHHTKDDKHIPKRLRIVNFWARTRFFQRAFMIWMIVWILSIIYNSQIFNQIFVLDEYNMNKNNTDSININIPNDDDKIITTTDGSPSINHLIASNDNSINIHATPAPILPSSTITTTTVYTDEQQFNLTKLKHPEFDINYHLSNFHWSSILRQYNISMSGKYVTILPTIRLSHAVTSDTAIHIRNKDEKPLQHFQWKALAVALDPIDFSDSDTNEFSMDTRGGGGGSGSGAGSTPLYPKSPMEIMLAAILCCISVFVLTYTMIVFYRCICTRNYAEWRASWNDTDDNATYPKQQRVLEGVPIQVKGHTHRIECLITDGTVVATSCLEGQVKLWDAANGDELSNIDRKQYFHSDRQIAKTICDVDGIVGGSSSHRMLQRSVSINLHEKVWAPIWCLDYLDNLIVIGCADGRMEFWEGTTGTLKVDNYIILFCC